MSFKLGEKEFSVFHWDTFEDIDESTFLLDSFDTLPEAEEYVGERYKGRISGSGADQVHIVNKSGNVMKRYNVQ